MANHSIQEPKNFSEELRKLLTTDPSHAETFNPLFERLINNDAFIKALVEQMINAHTHSGADGDGTKIPLANIDIPAGVGGIVTDKDMAHHINERNPHGTRAVDVGAVSSQDFTTHLGDLVKHGVYGAAAGTNTLAMEVTLNASITSYPTGMLVAFKNTTANTGAVTLNINKLGAKSIRKANGSTLASGNLKAGGVYQCRYDGVNFMLLGEGGEYGTVIASDVRNTKTFGTEDGAVQGTLDLSKLIASNIRKGVTIDNVIGSLIPLTGEKKWATGTISFSYNQRFTISGVGFRPTILFMTNSTRNSNNPGFTVAAIEARRIYPNENSYKTLQMPNILSYLGSDSYFTSDGFTGISTNVSTQTTDYNWLLIE